MNQETHAAATTDNGSSVTPLNRWLRKLSLSLLVATVVAQLRWPLLWDRFAISHWVVGLGTAAMVAHILLRFRWRGALVAISVTVTAWLVETVGVAFGIPFGEYQYATSVTYLQCPAHEVCSDVARATHHLTAIAGVPIIVLAAWFMVGYAAHITARGIAVSRVLQWLWSTLMLAAWDLYLDPQFILDPHLEHGWWLWSHSQTHLPGVPGIPVSNYLGWLLAAGLIQGVIAAIIGRRAGLTTRVWDTPTWFMVWTWIGGAVAVGWFLKQPAAAAWGGFALLPAMLVLLRNHLRRGSHTTSREHTRHEAMPQQAARGQ